MRLAQNLLRFVRAGNADQQQGVSPLGGIMHFQVVQKPAPFWPGYSQNLAGLMSGRYPKITYASRKLFVSSTYSALRNQQ